MFLAAARVHWGGPPWVPVLLASPARFLFVFGGFGLWSVVGLLAWGTLFGLCVVVVGFWVSCPFPGMFGCVWCACCSGIRL